MRVECGVDMEAQRLEDIRIGWGTGKQERSRHCNQWDTRLGTANSQHRCTMKRSCRDQWVSHSTAVCLQAAATVQEQRKRTEALP